LVFVVGLSNKMADPEVGYSSNSHDINNLQYLFSGNLFFYLCQIYINFD